MIHLKQTCLAHHLIIADKCGLACANCGACKCGECNKKQPEIRPLNDHEIGGMIGKNETKNNVKFKTFSEEDKETISKVIIEETKTFY